MKIPRIVSLVCLAASLAPAQGFAKQILVRQRVYLHSCGYYSNRTADFQIAYKDDGLPADAKVELRFGLGGEEAAPGQDVPTHFDWDRAQSTALESPKPGTWVGSISQIVASRGSPKYYSSLQFVFVIHLPDGHSLVDDGLTGTPGFYESTLKENGHCVDSAEDVPPFEQTEFHRADRG